MPVDVFDPAFKLPREMYIIGTGPNLNTCIDRIPGNGNIIFLNKAIEAPIADIGSHGWWLCMDGKLGNQGWFQAWARMLCREGPETNVTPVFETKILARLWPKVPWTFEQGMNLKEEPKWVAAQGVLRNGATIAGMALQLCYWKNVRAVHLAGCDFTGRKYFDGTEKNDNQDDGVWPHLENMNRLIDLFRGGPRALSMRIDSLSETALDVEII